MEELERVCFQIISWAGEAKSCYLAAVRKAQKGCFEEVQQKLEEGMNCFLKGHDIHRGILQQEMNGKGLPVSLLLLHAEDQLMSVETCKLFAEEFIDTYRRVAVLEETVNKIRESKEEKGGKI